MCQQFQCEAGDDRNPEAAVIIQTARELAATSALTFLLNGAFLELSYRWIKGFTLDLGAPEAVPASLDLIEALANPGPVATGTPISQFLARQCVSSSQLPAEPSSFLVFARHFRKCSILLAFGFPAAGPLLTAFPAEISERLELAAFAAWSTQRLGRLQAELRAANERLAATRTVERAKALLQTELQVDEPRAYEYLRRTSRQRRIPIPALAREIVSRSGSPSVVAVSLVKARRSFAD